MGAGSLDSLIVSPADFQLYNGHRQVHTFELPRPTDDLSTTPLDSNISPHDLVDWLNQPCPRSDRDHGTMKLVLLQTRNQSTAKKAPSVSSPPPAYFPYPAPNETKQRQTDVDFVLDLLQGMDLPLASFGSYLRGHITFVCIPATYTTNNTSSSTNITSRCTKYYCSGTSWTITWSFCPIFKHTSAIMWHREGDGDQRKTEVLADLVRLQQHLAHPMLLGFVKTKISLSFTFDMLDDMNRETLELEQAIGFPTWNWMLDRAEPGRGVGDALDQAVEGFNLLSGKLTNIKFRLRTFQQQIKFISRCNAGYRLSLDGQATNFESLMRECDELQLYMDVMWDYTFVHLFDADSLTERLQNAMNSVFQLTTQRDSRASLAIADINNELAWQGRNNNTAMMTIAFISLLFLPGTFVASFFQTPIFNFPSPPPPQDGGNGNVIVARPFWIYWTVSGVLTLVLGAGWIKYLRRRREVDMQEREFERVQFRERIRRRGVAAFVLERRTGRRGWGGIWGGGGGGGGGGYDVGGGIGGRGGGGGVGSGVGGGDGNGVRQVDATESQIGTTANTTTTMRPSRNHHDREYGGTTTMQECGLFSRGGRRMRRRRNDPPDGNDNDAGRRRGTTLRTRPRSRTCTDWFGTRTRDNHDEVDGIKMYGYNNDDDNNAPSTRTW
ncbi:hypothetical protein PV08_07789 [Exophiala spinifera]|uniref:Uncharacterized protein n=1 Tax=Exophiala spinifera TaxID=91928 RepID=A0A0D1ZQH5_9EURO|nr:uncharacterized protein PV08_07789 [Exophiala spinifera]KIW15002.1 hypothetical protein PV08_07789 [Exophiala spinifera]